MLFARISVRPLLVIVTTIVTTLVTTLVNKGGLLPASTTNYIYLHRGLIAEVSQ
jgi:hypothetical protein